MNLNNSVTAWKTTIASLLAYYNDKVTIHYKPVRSGTSNSFDSFFNEAVDSTDPDNVGVAETTPASVDIYGKFHTDLYSKFISSNNDDMQIQIGTFEQSDAVFTCLYSDAVKDTSDGSTYFDDANYIYSDKDKTRYEIISIKKRGLTDIFLVDVFLKKTNK